MLRPIDSRPCCARGRFRLRSLALPCLLAGPALAQGTGAHVHGVVKLDLAIDAGLVTIAMEAPLDSLLGFEHPPRSDAERKAAQALLQRLRSGQGLFAIDPAAQCTLKTASAESEALAPGAQTGEHADLDARFEWACPEASAARSVDIAGLLGAYRRIRSVDVQIVAPSGQVKQTLKAPAHLIRWGR